MSRITAPLQDMVQKKEHRLLVQRPLIRWSRHQKGGMVDVAIHELGAKVVEVKVLDSEKRENES